MASLRAPAPRHHAAAPFRGGPEFKQHAHVAGSKAPQLFQRQHHHHFALPLAAPGVRAHRARVISN